MAHRQETACSIRPRAEKKNDLLQIYPLPQLEAYINSFSTLCTHNISCIIPCPQRSNEAVIFGQGKHIQERKSIVGLGMYGRGSICNILQK